MRLNKTLSLRNSSEFPAGLLWDSFVQDLSVLPFSWPRNFADFSSWLQVPNENGLNNRFVVVDDSLDPDLPLALVATDLVKEGNQHIFKLAPLQSVNISYTTHPDYFGKGIATKALELATKKIVELEYEPILRIASFNKASQAVAKKCGYHLTRSEIVIQYEFDYEPTLLHLFTR